MKSLKPAKAAATVQQARRRSMGFGKVTKHLVVYLTCSRYDVIYARWVFLKPVGVPIYGVYCVGSRICRIIEIAWTI